jgi:hypothetical protein
MLFRSTLVSAQWDTWCYYHHHVFYLYYLITASPCGEIRDDRLPGDR